jgi:hypothetical protein
VTAYAQEISTLGLKELERIPVLVAVIARSTTIMQTIMEQMLRLVPREQVGSFHSYGIKSKI